MRIKPHPGEMLREEFLEPLGMSGRQLAEAIGVPHNRINDILRERRGVTADTAIRLGTYFRTSAQMWLTMQTAHDLSKARAEHADDYARLPVHA